DADADALEAHTSASGSLSDDAERLLAAGVTDELEISRVLGTNRPQNNHR
ncbi:MAG: hypothetical protein HZB38_09060, partial [Planctomycetes bacterium]|nr:hypothetical protein [Planctomycetota bacterium]